MANLNDVIASLNKQGQVLRRQDQELAQLRARLEALEKQRPLERVQVQQFPGTDPLLETEESDAEFEDVG